MKRVVLFAGGATGGHIYPGVAIAERLAAIAEIEPHFISSGTPVESRILDRTGFTVHAFAGPVRWRQPWRLWPLRRKLSRLYRDLDPCAMVALGGRSALLPSLAAVTHSVPLFLHEQNRVLGRAHRLLAPLARRVFLSYVDTRGERRLRRRSLSLGCPVRSTFTAAELPRGATQLLVLGGSQGATAVNRIMMEALPRLEGRALRVTHLVGVGKGEEVRASYRRHGVEADVRDYVDDPARCFHRASLVVARAGGSTVAELAAVGRPSILVPYPYHSDRQQFLNAEALVEVGAARVIAESATELGDALIELSDDRERLLSMARAAREAMPENAADRIAEVIATHVERAPRGQLSTASLGEGTP